MTPKPLSIPCLEKAPEVYDDEYEHPQGPETINKTLEIIREDRSAVEQNLAQLRVWIAKHPHIRLCRTDARFLLRFLRARKHSFLSASQVLERYLAARIIHPTWFQRLDIRDPELADLTDIGFVYPLKERSADGCLITLCDWGLLDPKRYTIDHSNRMHALLAEAYSEDALFQCAGVVGIFDMQHVQLAHHSIISLTVLRQVAQYVNNAIPIRCKAIYAVNIPSGALWIVNGLLGFFNEKIRNRCRVFRDYDELAENIDRNLLPKEYGGKEPKSEHIRAFREQCERYRDRMLTLDEMEIDLDHNEPYSRHVMLDDIEGGAVGSFRKLELD
ncbi:alpha-tocopherol transfer protein-like [Anopheles marshallii]|uniref:alpha-tocopherol transfer protein-like n=1 Tax=Anopheles marshallii TaxID=1521116 RepID=UPI00237B306E|nr:alpha-tocopherol transfer protein-like [Anopheles marshallii]